MKCTVCREPAVIDLRRHNSNFCAPHFTKFCRDQTQKAIDEFDMLYAEQRYFMLAMHPEIIGRPSRIAMLERLIRRLFTATTWQELLAPAH